jgi:tyrosyl-tRNA synthetase
MGRELQKSEGQRPQTVLMMPLLEGLDGVQKMSKSLNNYIGITDSPTEMFGKIMSISDDLMWRYYELLSFKPIEEIEGYKTKIAEGMNPRDVKIDLAKELITRFHDEALAQGAHDEFINRFQKGAMPDDMPELAITAEGGEIAIANLLKEASLVVSTSDAFRMIKQGAVKIDGEKVMDKSLMISSGSQAIYQVGKRKFAKVTIK